MCIITNDKIENFGELYGKLNMNRLNVIGSIKAPRFLPEDK